LLLLPFTLCSLRAVTQSTGNTLAAAALALRHREPICGGGLDEVFAALEAMGDSLCDEAAVVLGAGGKIELPIAERQARRCVSIGASASDVVEPGAAHAVSDPLTPPRTLQALCSDLSVPAPLA
jgi:hypothetical protein